MIESSSPNQPVQNYEIVNPTLEQQVATLLPSVAGYGGNLRSTNTIIPIVDLTSAAEGSTLPESLQFALAFGSQTAFSAGNGTTALANTPGFWRLVGSTSVKNLASTTNAEFNIEMTDGVSTKKVFGYKSQTAPDLQFAVVPFDLVFFLDTGVTLQITNNTANIFSVGSYRQLADKAGTLVDPSGFA